MSSHRNIVGGNALGYFTPRPHPAPPSGVAAFPTDPAAPSPATAGQVSPPTAGTTAAMANERSDRLAARVQVLANEAEKARSEAGRDRYRVAMLEEVVRGHVNRSASLRADLHQLEEAYEVVADALAGCGVDRTTSRKEAAESAARMIFDAKRNGELYRDAVAALADESERCDVAYHAAAELLSALNECGSGDRDAPGICGRTAPLQSVVVPTAAVRVWYARKALAKLIGMPDGDADGRPQVEADDPAAWVRIFPMLWRSQSEWSQRVFGADSVRGPAGAMRHAREECDEAVEAFELGDVGKGQVEVVDTFLLALDAARRSGMTPSDLLTSAWCKHSLNKRREWTPAADGVFRHVGHVDKAPAPDPIAVALYQQWTAGGKPGEVYAVGADGLPHWTPADEWAKSTGYPYAGSIRLDKLAERLADAAAGKPVSTIPDRDFATEGVRKTYPGETVRMTTGPVGEDGTCWVALDADFGWGRFESGRFGYGPDPKGTAWGTAIVRAVESLLEKLPPVCLDNLPNMPMAESWTPERVYGDAAGGSANVVTIIEGVAGGPAGKMRRTIEVRGRVKGHPMIPGSDEWVCSGTIYYADEPGARDDALAAALYAWGRHLVDYGKTAQREASARAAGDAVKAVNLGESSLNQARSESWASSITPPKSV